MVYHSCPRGLAGVEDRQDVRVVSRAVVRISRRKRSGPSVAAQLGVQDLERDRPVVPEVMGEVDRGHAAAAELALERGSDRLAQLEGGQW